MSTTLRRWMVPLLAAAAVLVVMVAVLQVIADGPADTAAAGFGDGPGVNGGTVGSADGSVGGGRGAVRGDRGDASDFNHPPAMQQPAGEEPPMTDEAALAIDSYVVLDGGRRLALNYTNGVPECYGEAGHPLVEESPNRVLVTLPRIEPTASRDVACIDIAVLKSVEVVLDQPLGDRVVVDGARDDWQINEEQQAYGTSPTG